ncbi:MAG: TetM/TetW/TetO/TetS family tetracycline resistance ribosomal protection protein [Ruthenibacterium sp.]
MKKLVVGILAHVDSGKTTLSEALLYCAGALAKLGRVDHGNAFLDSFALERARGITIFSKQAILRQNDIEITLLDTPGHVDFSTEMERTLQVLDYAVLVISGTDGIQSHTETLWNLLAQHQIPTFLFVNKMDLPGSDRTALLAALHKLSGGCVAFDTADTPPFYEAAAACDEALLETFFASNVLSDDALAAAVARRRIFPCYFGCALKLTGVNDLLAGLTRFTQMPCYPQDFGAAVFKISHDAQGNRLTHLKITGGFLRVKSTLTGDGWTEKINQIRLYSGAKFTVEEEVFAGSICAVTGLSQTFCGESFGTQRALDAPVLEPVLTYHVALSSGANVSVVLDALRVLQEEDPQLHVAWNERLQEIEVQLMGEVQLEILKEILHTRFGLTVAFGQGNLVYKETIADTVEGVGHFEPLRHYAEVHLLLTPGARGSGLRFATTCSEDVLDKNWQKLILTHLAEKTHIGTLTGSPITDMCITLASGKAHQKHTEGGDFRQATYRALRQGLRQANIILLEPWYTFRLEVPTENIGRAMSDFKRMDGDFLPPEAQGNMSVLAGRVSVAAVRDYQMELHSYTRGKGRLVCTLCGYAPCHNTDEVVAALAYDCESDVENTADSVFCEHGAGFTVKWNDVPRYMQLESVLPKTANATPQTSVSTRSAPRGSLEEDRELLAIYERTYGPVHRDVKNVFRPPQKEPPQINTPAPQFAGREYLLVDGYNIIFAWDELAVLAQENLDAARQNLIQRLCNYQGYHPCELILVFDAYKLKGNVGAVEKIHNISVVYTKEAETADMYIEKATQTLGQNRYVRVATSDGIEQMIILGHGALRVSARAFHAEVLAVEQAIRVHLTS